MYILQRACEIQLLAQSGGGELTPVPSGIVEGMQAAAKQVTRNAGGALAWPGLLRKLDRLGAPYQQ
jgi:ribulose-5-phosphate 4-epimerase/fuculose-1-phosphate aldolase